MTTNDAALVCKNVTKRFGSLTALSAADLSVKRGSIHALLGENGAGKSTLINIVSGLIASDSGELELFGNPIRFRSPLEAAAAGIGVVHQHFLLAGALSVAENVALGVRASMGGWNFNRKKAEANVAELAEKTGLAIDPRAPVRDLPVGMRQRVEILKALSRGAKILLLDEPTAVLAPPEIQKLFTTLRQLRETGRTIVIITHKLDEVFSIASETTVLRAGKTVFSGALDTLNPRELAQKMIGQETPAPALSTPIPVKPEKVILEMRCIEEAQALRVDELNVQTGEIVGIAGVEGNGQQELADLLSGLRTPRQSNQATPIIRLGNADLIPLNVQDRNKAGFAYIPSDRQREGLILEMSLTENLFLRRPILRHIPGITLLDLPEMTAKANTMLREFSVVPPKPSLAARALSGGNQQKVVEARELSSAPLLILACNPTRGLDVGAAAEVQNRLLSAARKNGAGILLISADLDEVLALSDRICVLYRGRLSEIGPRGVSKETVGRAMVGA